MMRERRRQARTPQPYKYLDLFFAVLIVLAGCAFVFMRCHAEEPAFDSRELEDISKLHRRMDGAPVVLSGKYVCYMIARNHGFCRFCQTCQPKFKEPITIRFSEYHARPQ